MSKNTDTETTLSELLFLKPEEQEEFLKRYTSFLSNEQRKSGNLTKTLVKNGLVLVLKDLRKKRKEKTKQNIFKNIKHKCLIQHKEKFLELLKMNLGSKAISKYFTNTLHCKVSHVTVQKAINILKGSENG